MSQNTGRVKPGRSGSFGKPSQPRQTTAARTTREPGGSRPAAMGKSPMVQGKTVTHTGLPRKGR